PAVLVFYQSYPIIHSASLILSLFSFTPPSTTPIYTLSLHDALPISSLALSLSPIGSVLVSTTMAPFSCSATSCNASALGSDVMTDRKSTRLNSSHVSISYAVFCLKKKNKGRVLMNFSLVQSFFQ